MNQKNEPGSAQEFEELTLQTRMERIGKKILVLSGKGGVGKSTVAANLAVSLAEKGHKVGLLDVDLHGPSIPHILNLSAQKLDSDEGGTIYPIALSPNLSVISVGLLLSSASDAVIWRGPMKYNVIRQFLKDVAWGALDYLVIDSPPGTGDEPLAVAQMVGPRSMAVIVTTPQQVAVADVRRSVSFCRSLNIPVAGILENMSGFICPHCQEKVDLFKTDGGRNLAEEMEAPFLGAIPLDPAVMQSGDAGAPFMQALSDSPVRTAFGGAVDKITAFELPQAPPACPSTGSCSSSSCESCGQGGECN